MENVSYTHLFENQTNGDLHTLDENVTKITEYVENIKLFSWLCHLKCISYMQTT